MSYMDDALILAGSTWGDGDFNTRLLAPSHTHIESLSNLWSCVAAFLNVCFYPNVSWLIPWLVLTWGVSLYNSGYHHKFMRLRS